MSKEIDYGSHELLDRIYVIKTNLEEMVQDHISIVNHQNITSRIDEALALLEEAYQELGKEIL